MEDSRHSSSRHAFDRRDRLILALVAQLRAERETRDALEATIRQGSVSREVLLAMVSDPVPVVTSEDIAEVEHRVARQKTNTASDTGKDI